jgi:hypothetical protein
MKSNTMNMSQTDPGSTDAKLSHKRLFFLSTTTDGNILTSQYPKQINSQKAGYMKLLVRFSLNGNAFKENNIFGKPVNFFKEKAKTVSKQKKDSQRASDKSNMNLFSKFGLDDTFDTRNLKKITKELDTKEERITSDDPTLTNFIQYVDFVDVLADKNFDKKIDPRKICEALSELNDGWERKIRIFLTVDDFNSMSQWHTIYDILDETEDNIELTLTPSEIKKLKGNDKTTIKTAGLKQLATAIYTIAYSSDGLEATKMVAMNQMMSYGLGCEITIEDSNGKEPARVGNLVDEVIGCFDEVEKSFTTRGSIYTANAMQQSFRTFSTYAYNCKFVNIALLQMYSDWLKKYTKNVKNMVLKIKNKLETMSFEEIFNYMMQFFDVFKEMLKLFGITVTYSNLKTSAKKISKWIYMAKGKSILIDYFVKSYKNEKYHYDELCYFKRSVIMYKNKLINQLRGDERTNRFGDLSVLYNNADAANRKMLK